MDTLKKQIELLKNIDGTVEEFPIQHENEELKAVGLGGKYCDNKSGRYILSPSPMNFGSFSMFYPTSVIDFISIIWGFVSDACFYDAIEFSENKENNNMFDSNHLQKASDIPYSELRNIIDYSIVLKSFIWDSKPNKTDLVNHIINILSQKNTDCIDLIGLDSDLLEHINSMFTEQSIFFENEESEEVYKGFVLHSEEKDTKAIVMIDDCITVVTSEYDYINVDDQPRYGWTW